MIPIIPVIGYYFLGLIVLTFRHHIHLICDCLDSSVHLIHDQLNLFFRQEAHITSDLFLVRSESANYSWNCINTCDFVILLLGDSYGRLTNTGVSQLHISYLNAKTKNKPLIVLIKEGQGKPRQLNDLIYTIKQQIPITNIHYFDDGQNFNQLIQNIYTKLKNHNHTMSSTLKLDADTTSKVDTRESKFNYIKNLAQKESSTDNLFTQPSNIKHRHDFTPKLQDTLVINCNAHAFKGGTLIEVSFTTSSTWLDVVLALKNSSSPFTSQGFWRILNEIITPQALKIIQATHPDVHAVSRCQVTKSDALSIRETLIHMHWIEKSSIAKEAWKVTDSTKDLIKTQNAN